MNLPPDLGFESHPHDARRMVRREPRETEVAAAAAVQRTVNALQLEVLAAISDLGGAATAEQVEQLPQFTRRAPSTIRKRISELAQMGRLVADGTRLNSRALPMTLWRKVSPGGPAREGAEGVTPESQPTAEQATPQPTVRGFEVGERVRVRATRQLAEVYEVRNAHEAAFAQHVLCGWSISTAVERCEWFDGHELERLP